MKTKWILTVFLLTLAGCSSQPPRCDGGAKKPINSRAITALSQLPSKCEGIDGPCT